MLKDFHNQRDLGKPTFIFQKTPAVSRPEQVGEKFQPESLKKSFEKDFFKGLELPKVEMSPHDILKFVKETFQNNFSPQQYEDKLRPYIEKHVQDSNVADRIVKDARIRYDTMYTALMARFYRKAENGNIKYEELKDGIRSTTRDGLDKLLKDVESSVKAKTTAPKGKAVKPAPKTTFGAKWPHEIPIIGPVLKNVDIPILGILLDSKEYRKYKEFQYQTKENYSKFAKALGTKYLESKQHEEFLTASGKRDYKRLAGEFKKGMEAYTANQLEFIFENTKDQTTLKRRLTALRDRIKGYYEAFDANGDGILDLHELKKVEKASLTYMDLIRIVNSTDDESALYKKLETMNFFNREAWSRATDLLTEQLIKDATKNGSEASLIALVKKWTGSKADMSFEKAADEFREIMKKRAKTGIKKTLDAVREFNKAINGQRAEILKLEDIKPDSIRYLVRREREMILSRRTEPKNIDDRMIAEFMSTNFVGRCSYLNNPVRRQALFQAIQNIKKHYPRIYSKEYRRSIPRKISQLVSSRNPDKPTGHDRAARLLAILTLAKEAEWVIKNLDKSKDYKNDKLYKQLDNTEPEKLAPPADFRFRDTRKLYSTRYITTASRYGFNGRDLGLNALKIWAGATIFINFMNARKQGWKGVGRFIQNPYLYAGIGAIYGINKYQQNPEARRYLFEDAGGKERIATHIGLVSLSKKAGRQNVIRFINNPYEFKAMQEIMADPKKGVNIAKRLKQKAYKRNSRKPVLTKGDLKDHLSDSAYSQLPTSQNDRVRYLFYEKFLSTPRNIRTLRANCLNWQ